MCYLNKLLKFPEFNRRKNHLSKTEGLAKMQFFTVASIP